MHAKYINRLVWFLPLLLMTLGMRTENNAGREKAAQESLYRTADRAVDAKTKVVRYLYRRQPFSGYGNPADIAVAFLQKNRKMLGIEEVTRQLALQSEQQTPAGSHLNYRQMVEGIPVYQADITLTLAADGHIAFLASRFRPGLSLSRTTAAFDPADAIKYAENAIQLVEYFPFDPQVELVAYETETGQALLAYCVRLAAAEPRGDWEVIVNASDGSIIRVRNLIMYNNSVSGSGAVWNPDPLTTARVYYGGPFADPDGLDMDRPELNAQRFIVPLKDITEQDGKYFLQGPFVRLADIDRPGDIFPTPAHPDSFIFTRSQQGFECVMVYYHVDGAGRYLRDLGFDISGLNQFKVDPHGANGEDNSYYLGSGNFCAFGEGGVDDAEDASVIWHEYAHAIQENIAGMTYTGETASLQEGSADYWAASYIGSLSDFNRQNLFIWDAGKTGPGESYGIFWAGRRYDLDLHYPEQYDFQSGVIHKNGQIWSSALMHIRDELGRETTDQIFIQSHYLWGSAPGFEDAARAFIQSDSLLYQGQHTRTIIYWFQQYGLIRPESYGPVITHQPLPDREHFAGSLPVAAHVLSESIPLDTADVWVFWDTTGNVLQDSAAMIWDPDSGYFSADLPADGKDRSYRYYIRAGDSSGRYGWLPAKAPDSVFSFRIGADLTPPVATHQPLGDQAAVRWPPEVLVSAWDNVGIDSVIVECGVDSAYTAIRFPLQPGREAGWFTGNFGIPVDGIEAGDQIFYRIRVADKAALPNLVFLPDSGFYNFNVLGDGGEILLDPETGAALMSGSGDWQNGDPVNGPGSAFSGDRVWGTRLNNAYSNGPALSKLTTLPVSLEGFNHAELSFWHWYDIESHLDGGNVKISVDKGGSWEFLIPWYGYDTMINDNFGNPIGGQPAFSGRNARWHKVCFDLGPYRGKDILLRFDFGSDITGTLAGWFIDSVSIADREIIINGPRDIRVLDNRQSVSMAWLNCRPDAPELPPSNYQQEYVPPEAFLHYFIYRREAGGVFARIDSTRKIAWRDSLVLPGRTYQYFIRAGAGGLLSSASDTVSVFVQPVTGIAADPAIPDRFVLFPNYPNPFNPETRIAYQVPVKTQVRLRIYDIAGKLVRELVDESRGPGRYEIVWNSDNAAGRAVASGIYILLMESESFKAVRKLVLLR